MNRPQGQANLKLVNEETGEVLGEAQDLREEIHDLKAQLTEMEAELRSKRATIRALKEDRDQRARNDHLWPEAYAIFNYWRAKCRHPKAKFGVDRFELMLPYIRDYGPMTCKRAIDGAAFDPYQTKRKNGTVKRHDGLDLIFRNSEKFEEFANRAPRAKKPSASPQTTP